MATQMTISRAEYYQKMSSIYTNNGWDRIKRHYKYIRMPKQETENNLSVAMTCICTGAILGAKIGNIIGRRFDKTTNLNSSSKPVGAMVGTTVGFVGGGVAGGYSYMTLTELNPNFQTWKKTCLSEAVKIAITNAYAEEEILMHFTCPVSLCVMDVPTHTPAGNYFDMVFLMNCGRESNGNIKDPYKNPSFPENEAKPDFERSIVIHKRTRYLLKSDLQSNNLNHELRSSLETQLKYVELDLVNRYENGREEIEERRRNSVVTHEVYKKEIEEFEQLFGTDWQTDLDWNIDWVKTCNERWVYFHPGSKIVGFN